jgi:death on curing protein
MKLINMLQLELIHMQILDATNGAYGTHSSDRIEAVIASQRQHVFGSELYSTVFDKAAALCRGIIQDHPFIDANKRTGMLTAELFLLCNGYELTANDQQFEDFAVYVAVDRLEVAAIAEWLEAQSVIIEV